MKNADLQKVLEFCENEKLYFGEGNPNAKILFIGQEIGYGLEKLKYKQPNFAEIKEKSEKEINQNLRFWQERCQSNYVEQYLQDIERLFREKPNRTWENYQKIVNVILGRDINEKQHDFLNYSFITEYSQLSLPKSQYRPKEMDKKEFDKKKKESINERKALFSQEFFQNFPIIIMACGHYPTKLFPMDIETVFGVKWCGESKGKIGNYYNLHQGENKILIHTRQVSMGVTNELLFEIAELCKPIYDKHIECEMAKILNAAEKRWNNGGKEIYEAMQNNPDFIHSPEYKKYMENLEKEN